MPNALSHKAIRDRIIDAAYRITVLLITTSSVIVLPASVSVTTRNEGTFVAPLAHAVDAIPRDRTPDKTRSVLAEGKALPRAWSAPACHVRRPRVRARFYNLRQQRASDFWVILRRDFLPSHGGRNSDAAHTARIISLGCCHDVRRLILVMCARQSFVDRVSARQYSAARLPDFLIRLSDQPRSREFGLMAPMCAR